MSKEWVEKRKETVKTIIDGLENYEPFLLMLEDKKASSKFSDDNWHLIDLEDKDKLLELKYNKLASEKMVHCIEEYKQELASYDNNEDVNSYYED